MRNRILNFSALFLLMLITGVFWGTWFTMTRTIEVFSPEEFIHIGQTIIANVALPMRIIMPSGIILIVISLLIARNKKKSTSYIAGIFSFILIIAVLLITLLILVPVDNQIKIWTAATVPADWQSIRDKWELFHSMRTLLSLISFGCYSIFAMGNIHSTSE